MLKSTLHKIQDCYKLNAYIEKVFSEHKYLAQKDISKLINKYNVTINKIGKIEIFVSIFYFKYFLAPIKLKRTNNNFIKLRTQHNEEFVASELALQKNYFDNLFDYKLDNEQRKAIIIDEDNSLIIAGAGSGKTTTITGKIKYLIDNNMAAASEILPLVFTREAKKSLQVKIDSPMLNARTFHSFGLSVIKGESTKLKVLTEESKISKILKDILARIADDPDKSDLIVLYFEFSKIAKSQFEFETLGEYIQYVKDQGYVTYKKVEAKYGTKNKITYNNEKVKSIEECIIANYLFVNRVSYSYEQKYPYIETNVTYQPDFTISQNGKTIYLEHLALSRSGDVPPFFKKNGSYQAAKYKYNAKVKWARQVHASNGTTLLETYSYEFDEGNFIKVLEKKLLNAGIQLDPMSPKELWTYLKAEKDPTLKSLMQLLQTSLALYKSNLRNMDYLRKQNEMVDDDKLNQRNSVIIDLFEEVYKCYEEKLLEQQVIDYHDMINQATQNIESGEYVLPLKYILVDEFQDLSIGRYRLVKALLNQNPEAKLFCVGDDWQSIFRFAGSDLTLVENFEQHFGYTYFGKIQSTHRFSDPLLSQSGNFIMQNKNQQRKKLVNKDKKTTSFVVYGYENSLQEAKQVGQLIEYFNLNNPQTKDDIIILGRYKKDVEALIQHGNSKFSIGKDEKTVFYQGKGGITYEATYYTAHKAKGKEAKYTIIINCNSRAFPDEQTDDPFLNLLLSKSDQYPNGEERRLFYVAMTRAEKGVVALHQAYNASKFINEIFEKDNIVNKCPECKTGNLIIRNGTSGKFKGCSNYAYGCTYINSDVSNHSAGPASFNINIENCPLCGDGTLTVTKQSKIVCSNSINGCKYSKPFKSKILNI